MIHAGLLLYILEASLKMKMYTQDVSIVNDSSWRVLMQAIALAMLLSKHPYIAQSLVSASKHCQELVIV